MSYARPIPIVTVTFFVLCVCFFIYKLANVAPRGFGDLGRMAIYFQGAGEHW